MVDDDLNRWIARLPLAEQVALRRHDEQMAAYVSPKDPRQLQAPRCKCCGVKLEGPRDILGRCGTCRARRRLEKRRWRLRSKSKQAP